MSETEYSRLSNRELELELDRALGLEEQAFEMTEATLFSSLMPALLALADASLELTMMGNRINTVPDSDEAAREDIGTLMAAANRDNAFRNGLLSTSIAITLT